MKNFDENADDMLRFSWVGMFSVTSACSFVFYLFLLFIEGEHISLFLSIGSIAAVLSAIAYATRILIRRNLKNQSKKASIFPEN